MIGGFHGDHATPQVIACKQAPAIYERLNAYRRRHPQEHFPAKHRRLLLKKLAERGA